MRTIHFRPIVAGVVAFLAIVAVAAAGQTKPSAILNTLEVQELIKRSEPADHARLSAHFAALAEQHAADANRHTAMAQAFVANPAHGVAVNAAADHCKRLAKLNNQSAATLRELAAHHKGLAGGKTSPVPAGATRFEGGAGASTPTEQELRALAAKANTPADHGELQEYFVLAEKRYTAEANEHAAMAQAYRGTRIAQAASHCDRLVALSRDSAKEAHAAAAMHKDLAGVPR